MHHADNFVELVLSKPHMQELQLYKKTHTIEEYSQEIIFLKCRAEQICKQSSFKSKMYKCLSLFCSVFVVASGCFVTLFSSLNYLSGCTGQYNELLIALGVLITFIKSIQLIFNFDSRCVDFKKTNIKARKILREIHDIDIDDSNINQKIKDLSDRLDDMELNIFIDGVDDTKVQNMK